MSSTISSGLKLSSQIRHNTNKVNLSKKGLKWKVAPWLKKSQKGIADVIKTSFPPLHVNTSCQLTPIWP